jgi:hypothetical protein
MSFFYFSGISYILGISAANGGNAGAPFKNPGLPAEYK